MRLSRNHWHISQFVYIKMLFRYEFIETECSPATSLAQFIRKQRFHVLHMKIGMKTENSSVFEWTSCVRSHSVHIYAKGITETILKDIESCWDLTVLTTMKPFDSLSLHTHSNEKRGDRRHHLEFSMTNTVHRPQIKPEWYKKTITKTFNAQMQ